MTEKERKRRDITKLLQRKERVHFCYMKYKIAEKECDQEIEDYMRGVLSNELTYSGS